MRHRLHTPGRIKLVDVELSEPIRAIENLGGYDAVQALILLRSTPIGYVDVALDSARCSAEILQGAIREQLDVDRLDRSASSRAIRCSGAGDVRIVDGPGDARDGRRKGSQPLVSVVVCTRDRAADLASCLDALLRLDYPALDLLVVDNAPSNDATRRLVDDCYPSIRYVREPRPGLSWARNRGAVESHGEIVAYTEDDAIADERWIRALVSAFDESPDIAAATGLVVPLELETESQIFIERYGGFGCGFERLRYPEDRWQGKADSFRPGLMAECGTGANMAFRREVFDSVGYFDTALGAGTVTLGGEDLEMFFRVMKSGRSIMYEPSAVVRHRHRREYAELRGQIRGWGTGFFACLARSAALFPEERMRLLRLGAQTLNRLFLRWLVSLASDPGFPRGLPLVELRGGLTGVILYGQARRNARGIGSAFDVRKEDLVGQ